MKPRVMSLVLFTCMVGMVISPASISFSVSIISLFAVAIGSGAAGALNMWYESDLDALMSRTCLRPIPTGKIKKNKLYTLEFFYHFINYFTLLFIKFIIRSLIVINDCFYFLFIQFG